MKTLAEQKIRELKEKLYTMPVSFESFAYMNILQALSGLLLAGDYSTVIAVCTALTANGAGETPNVKPNSPLHITTADVGKPSKQEEESKPKASEIGVSFQVKSKELEQAEKQAAQLIGKLKAAETLADVLISELKKSKFNDFNTGALTAKMVAKELATGLQEDFDETSTR